jgi:hypothetical protein
MNGDTLYHYKRWNVIQCRKKTWSIFGPFGSLTFIDMAIYVSG